jgi:hypothetical protein
VRGPLCHLTRNVNTVRGFANLRGAHAAGVYRSAAGRTALSSLS